MSIFRHIFCLRREGLLMMKTVKMMISVLLIAVMLCGGAMAASYKANVVTNSMTVYNAEKEKIGSLPQGTAFTVKAISKDGNWAKISYKGKTGIASMKNIMFEKRIKVIAQKNTSMDFVTKASYKMKIAFKATIEKGTAVYAVGYHNGYLLVENSTGNGLGIVKASNFKKG